MRLLIECEFSNGTQVLIKDPATEADYDVLTAAQSGDPDAVLGVLCRIRPDGPERERLIRAGAIRSVTREPSTR